MIRMLRMIDMPLEQIKDIINGKITLEDYKKVAKIEHLKTFVFYPDIAIKNPADFILALCQYADEQKKTAKKKRDYSR